MGTQRFKIIDAQATVVDLELSLKRGRDGHVNPIVLQLELGPGSIAKVALVITSMSDDVDGCDFTATLATERDLKAPRWRISCQGYAPGCATCALDIEYDGDSFDHHLRRDALRTTKKIVWLEQAP